MAYFDVRVFNPLAPTNSRRPLSAVYRQHEQLKRRAYEQRIREVEHGSFTPLVFAATGGMGPSSVVMLKRLASMIAVKHHEPYSMVMRWLRVHTSYSLLRSAILCLRGSRLQYYGLSMRLTLPLRSVRADYELTIVFLKLLYFLFLFKKKKYILLSSRSVN